MTPRHALLAAVLASAWFLAPTVHATGNGGHGHDGASQGRTQPTAHANPSPSATAQAYGDNGDAGLPSATPASHPHTGTSSSGSAGSCGDNASGIGTLFASCTSRGTDPGNSGDNGDSGMGWQSMLPGSIQ